MKRRYLTPIAEWPWYLRWTLGALCLVCVCVPVGIVGALWEALRDGSRAFWRSDAWHMLDVILFAVLLGNRRD